MPGRFPLTPVALTDDPFCEDGFCNDTDNPAPFDPSIFEYVRWVGNLNRAVFDNNLATPYFQDTGIYTSDWFALQTTGGVKDIIVMRNEAPVVSGVPYLLPATGYDPWKANGTYTLNPATYPVNLQFLLVKVIRYNPNNANRAALLSPNVGSVAYSVYPPNSNILEFSDTVATYTGVFQFSNDASIVLATWNGL